MLWCWCWWIPHIRNIICGKYISKNILPPSDTWPYACLTYCFIILWAICGQRMRSYSGALDIGIILALIRDIVTGRIMISFYPFIVSYYIIDYPFVIFILKFSWNKKSRKISIIKIKLFSLRSWENGTEISNSNWKRNQMYCSRW